MVLYALKTAKTKNQFKRKHFILYFVLMSCQISEAKCFLYPFGKSRQVDKQGKLELLSQSWYRKFYSEMMKIVQPLAF